MDDNPDLSYDEFLASAGRAFRRSGCHDLLQQLISLVAHAGEVTSSGVLRPAVARSVIDRMGLDTWQVGALDAARGFEMSPSVARSVRERTRRGWRTAGDCPALDRLWSVAVRTNLVKVGARHARPADPVPGDDVALGRLALRVALSLVLWMRERGLGRAVPLVLMLLVGPTGRPRAKQELVDAWLTDPLTLTADGEVGLTRQEASSEIHDVLVHLGDAGLWERHDGRYEATELGELVWLQLSDVIDASFILDGGRWAEAARTPTRRVRPSGA